MMQITTPVASKPFTLFDSVPDDHLNFGHGPGFNINHKVKSTGFQPVSFS